MRARFRGNLPSLAAVVLLLAGCSKPPEPGAPAPRNTAGATRIVSAEPRLGATRGSPWFEEIAAAARVDFHHSSGHTRRFYMPEMETGGVGLLDYDGDGLLDIFCVQGGALDPAVTNRPGCKLYHNLGHWRFEDVTARAGVGGHGEYGMGCACADYDGDGRVDIYVTTLGHNLLYHNNGDGTFTEVATRAGVTNGSWSTSAAFVDYDGDGNLDLMVANYLHWSIATEVDCFSRGGLPDYCSPLNYKAPAMDTLYHNRGNGVFEDVTLRAGLDKAYGNGLGVVCADFNHDGRPDIFVANDAMPNQLWINQGDGTFKDEALLRGCAVNAMGMTEAGMGIAAVDVFQRGWLDLFVTHLVNEGNRLWLNTNGYFVDTVLPRGPGALSLPYTGFGVVFADFNNDGILDVYVGNGRVRLGDTQPDPKDPYAEPNTLMRGLGSGQFEEVQPPGGTDPVLVATSRGVAVGDLDNDGALDLVVINKDGPVHVLRNRVGHHGHWIMFRVLNRKGCDAIGAGVRLEAGGKVQWRWVMPNQSYCSSIDPRVHFGLGPLDQVDRVTVFWPDHSQQVFGPFPARRIYELRESQGDASGAGR